MVARGEPKRSKAKPWVKVHERKFATGTINRYSHFLANRNKVQSRDELPPRDGVYRKMHSARGACAIVAHGLRWARMETKFNREMSFLHVRVSIAKCIQPRGGGPYGSPGRAEAKQGEALGKSARKKVCHRRSFHIRIFSHPPAPSLHTFLVGYGGQGWKRSSIGR